MKRVKNWKTFCVENGIYADLIQIECRGRPEFYLAVSEKTKGMMKHTGDLWSIVTIRKPGIVDTEIMLGSFFTRFQKRKTVETITRFLSENGMKPDRMIGEMPVYRLKEKFIRTHLEAMRPLRTRMKFGNGGIKYAS